MYTPSAVPENAPSGLKAWLADQFRQIATELGRSINLPELTAAPAKPRDGMIVYADGTSWNPGAGEGFYGYQNGSWVKL